VARIDLIPCRAIPNYAPKGMMKGDVAVPVRLPAGYIGITEGAERVSPFQSAYISQEDFLVSRSSRNEDFFFYW
jgi:hypothetical protein